LALVLQDGAYAKQSIIEPEIVRRTWGKTEQQVRHGRKGRALTGLVGAVNHMQVRLARTEDEFAVLKPAVPLQGEFGEPH
jgi:hypothetical protein